MAQVVYGFPRILPPNVDFVTFSNEDIGFIATLATGTNDVYAFAMPYPASMDLMEESMVIWANEYLHQALNASVDDEQAWLEVHLSMLDREYPVNFRGALGDSTDEDFKAQFASGIHIGRRFYHPTDSALAGPQQWDQEVMQSAIYFPPVPLDLITPLYHQFINQGITIDPATGDDTAANFSTFENVAVRAWFTMRRLTALEISTRSQQIRFQRLDS